MNEVAAGEFFPAAVRLAVAFCNVFNAVDGIQIWCVLTTKLQYCSFFFRNSREPFLPHLTSRTYMGLSDWGVKFRLLVRASVFVASKGLF